MEGKMIIDSALVISTVALTHVTYRSIPPEHRARAEHHTRRVIVWTVVHAPRTAKRSLGHFLRWLRWQITTPFRR